MKSKLKHLYIGGILLASSDYGCAMNIRVSDMRLYGKPELWNQITDKNRIIETQKREKEKDKQLIEAQKEEIENLKKKKREFEEKMIDLEALVQRLQAEFSKNPTVSGISRANSSACDSNITINCEEISETSNDSEFLGRSISPIEKERNFSTAVPTYSSSMADIMLPPPSTEKNSREKKPYLPPFSPNKTAKSTVPPAPPPPPISSNKIAKSTVPPAPPPPPISSNNAENIPLDPSPISPFSSGNVKSSIPPAPPPPPLSSNGTAKSTVPPVPPAPQQISEKKSQILLLSRNSTNSAEIKKEKDSQVLIESVWADQRESLRKSLEIEQTAAKIVNIYLKNKPAKINSAILSYKEKVRDLEERLRDYETQQRNQENQSSKNHEDTAASDKSEEIFKTSDLLEIVSEISARLEDFGKSVNEKKTKSISKKSKSAAVKLGNNDAVSRKSDAQFFDISQRVNRMAIRYFNEVNREESYSKSYSNLKEIGDFVIESVKIADSLSDLENLRNKSKDSSEFANSADNFRELDKAVKFAFDILRLGQKISAELSRESANLKESKDSPKSNEISGIERRCLELSLEYIRSTCRGKNQLSKLLGMRDVLNSSLSQITVPDNSKHPLSIISKLPKDMERMIDKIADLFIQASSDKDNSSYSQFGTLSVNMAGNKINPGDAQIRNSDGDSRGNFFRNFFKNKNLDGKFGDGIIKLITADRNLCPHFDILLRDLKNKLKIIPQKKNPSKHSKKASADFKNSKFLCLLKSSDGDILPLSHNASTQLMLLKDRGNEVVEQVTAVSVSLREIPSYLSNYYNLFGEKLQTVSDCVNAIFRKNLVLNQFIEGNFGFSTENNQIVVKIDEKAGKKNENFSLTNNDMFRIIFSIILNRNLIEKSNSKLFLSNENISKNEVAEMTENLYYALEKVKKSLEFVMSENAFKNNELRKIFKIDKTEFKSDIINQLDNLMSKIH